MIKKIDSQKKYPSAEDITRHKLMDAGVVCVARYGIRKTNMRLIAEASGIARQTVYKYFPNKNELLAEAFYREGVALGEAAARYIERFPAPDEKMVEAFLYIYENLPKNPILARVLEPREDFLGTVGMSHYPFGQFGEIVFAQLFKENPALASEADSISELWIRGVMSFLTFPSPEGKTKQQLESFVRKRLLPGVGL